ncbi:MAG: dihydrolipoyl dehydrogenase [Proteobacteria bacterium]|nr:dihydrolipoyl dehydrogenase [Pseudomonadota bacterium]
MADKSFDVVVIGGGPGGYVCAIRAAQLGQKVAVVEREHLGGICLNWGCIPTKALLKASELHHAMTGGAEAFGLKAEKVSVDPEKIIGRSRDVAGKLSKGVGFLMKKNKIEVIEGHATFTGRDSIKVTKDGKDVATVSAKNFVVATGARAREIPGVLEADGKLVWTYREAMTPKTFPKSMLVIGAGAIGIEFATFYAEFGTKVTVVEAQNRILPVEDEEISKRLEKTLAKRGLDIKTQAKVLGLKHGKNDVTVTLEVDGKQVEQTVERVLLAIGVTGNVENLGLESIGVAVERGAIKVDGLYRTGVPGIWAIGDVVGAPWLAHVASHEGVICAEAIAGKNPHAMDYGNVPGCTYCMPQVASVGLTEKAAIEKGHTVKVGRYDYQANGKALAIGEPDGMVKTVFDAKTGELLGAHIIGAEATEMISTFLVARHLEATEESLAEACFPHPTLSEMMHESVLDSDKRALNA